MTASREIVTTEQLSTQRELQLLRDLQRLAGERASEEARIRSVLADGLQAAEQARDAVSTEIEREFNTSRAASTSEYEGVTGQARQRYEADRNAAQKEYKGLRHGVESELSRVKEAALNEKQQASWEALTVFDALKGRPRERFLATVKRLELNSQELSVLEHDSIEIMQMRRQWREFPAVEAASDGELSAADNVDQAIERASDLTTAVREAALTLHDQKLPRLFEGGWPFGVFFLLWIVAGVLSAVVMGPTNWLWIVVSLGIAIAAAVGLLAWLRPIARGQSGRQYQQIQQLLADARRSLRVALEAARDRGQREAQALVMSRDEQISAAEQRVHAMVGERQSWSEDEIAAFVEEQRQVLRERVDIIASAEHEERFNQSYMAGK